jgi:ribose-phosphate pyrophosphokinase
MHYTKFDDAFQITRYPAGEVHVQATAEPREQVIEVANCRTADDLFAVAMAARIDGFEDSTFFIPHMPFARHDHRRDRADGYPIEVVDHLLKGIRILTADPHSDVTGNLWPHIPQSTVVDFWRADFGDSIYVIPDAGAAKKAFSWLRPEDDFIQCLKRRDRATGKLSGFQVLDQEIDLEPERPLVIVDDLCDGGGTFMGLASELRRHGWRGPLTLSVTHGLFQPDRFSALVDVFDKVLTFGEPAVKSTHLTALPWERLFWASPGAF